MINPAYILLAADLNVTVTKASYLTTVYILFSGITPMFLVPYANVYGRKNLYMVLPPPCTRSIIKINRFSPLLPPWPMSALHWPKVMEES